MDCKDAVLNLQDAEADAYNQLFDNVSTKYDGILQKYEHTETMLNEYIAQSEAKGQIVSKKYYKALISNEKNNIAQLQKEQSALIKARDEVVASGAIKKGSEDWRNMCAEIDSVTQEIEKGNTALIEYANSIREINWQKFDLIQERISDVTEEVDFLIELMSNDKLFDDKGKMTDKGAATMALHGQNYNTHMYQADNYANEIKKLNNQIVEDPYNQDLIDRRNELIDLQRESILAAEDEKQAIKDLVEESINLELDALQELIDKKNEELQSEKDLYEYQKKVKEQTEEIADLEKQMIGYSGDNSEEAQVKVQELKVSLEEAKTDLRETEYDKYITDQQALLDNLYNQYELILNERLDNVDNLLQQVVDGVNASMGEEGAIATALNGEGAIATAIVNAVSGENGIKGVLESEAKGVGTTLSTAMNNIWSVGEGNAKSVLTTYGKGFQDKQTTTNAVLNGIKIDVNTMMQNLNKEANKDIKANKTSSSADKDPTVKKGSGSGGSKNPTKNNKKNTGTGDGKVKIGDKVTFNSGKYYYDSYGTKPLGSQYRGKKVYITNINKDGSHPYHISTGKKLGKGDLGWLKKNQISGYAFGKKNISNNELAWTQEGKKQEYIVRPSDGAILTPVAKGDSVLNANASNNIWNMANSPAEFIKDNLNLGVANVPNNSNTQNTYTQNLDKVVFNFPNVQNYNELLSTMQKDKNFERLILSMSIDRLTGGSSLAKGKAIR